mgnify:CR=1 FL=1
MSLRYALDITLELFLSALILLTYDRVENWVHYTFIFGTLGLTLVLSVLLASRVCIGGPYAYESSYQPGTLIASLWQKRPLSSKT